MMQGRKLRAVHAIAYLLRKAKLLQFVDWMYYFKNLINNRNGNREFISTHKTFAVPPAHLAFDAYGHTSWQWYFDSGVIDAKAIADILNSENMANHVRILEWGCGPGRVIRHLNDYLKHNNVELYGTDYNAESIKWCQSYIEGIKFYVNQIQPPFPFETNCFDCIYAISVFTHLSEAMHFEWIREIRRVLKPKGLIIMTTHGDTASNRLLSREKQLYDSGNLVVRGHVMEGKKWYLAYHPQKFIRDNLLKEFDVVSHRQFYPTQDIWVARAK